MMKTFLLLAVSSVVIAGALPRLPAKIILSALVLMAVVSEAARRPIRMRMDFMDLNPYLTLREDAGDESAIETGVRTAE